MEHACYHKQLGWGCRCEYSLVITWRSHWAWARYYWHLSRDNTHVGGLHHLRSSVDVHPRLIIDQMIKIKEK